MKRGKQNQQKDRMKEQVIHSTLGFLLRFPEVIPAHHQRTD